MNRAALPDTRGPSAVGRHARMDLVFERRGRCTILTHAYVEPPFRIGACLDLDGAAYLIVACTGPGVFDGDRLHQTVRVGRGAQVVLASQSAVQLHPSATGSPAHIVHEYDVDEEGELYAHWDPIIPFGRARVDQRFELRAAGTSRIYWSDAVMAGRAARGETWQFAALAHELRLTCESVVAYLERYRIEPACQSVARPWLAGSATYLSTVLMLEPRADASSAEVIQRCVEAGRGVRAGVDAVEGGLIVARLAAGEGPVFAAARGAVRDLALQLIFDRPNLVARK